jgi:pimeloyl-ACP methyl ester carboxylesterase
MTSTSPTTFALVPGAGGQAWYWHRVVAELERRGHTAVAVDLPTADDSAERDGRVHDPDDMGTPFVHDLPDDVAAALREQPFAQSGRPFEDPWPLSGWPDVPTRVLAGRDDRFFPAEFQRRIAADRLGLDVEEIPGGHLAALSRPAELADRLLACLGSR